MLSDHPVHPSLASADLARARTWYADRLGLEPTREWEELLLYRMGPSWFTVYRTPSAGTARNTVAGWRVDDLRAEVARLRGRGVVFEEYDLGPDGRTVDGIMDMGDSLSAWFKDADGNVIAIAEANDEPNPHLGLIAVLAVADLARAKAWYAERLGLTPSAEWDGLARYESGPTRFNLYQTSAAGTARNTVAVWRVDDLRSEVETLRSRGVVLEEYDFGDVRTVDGILTDPDTGTLNAWFTDSEGNVLGIVEDHEYTPDFAGPPMGR